VGNKTEEIQIDLKREWISKCDKLVDVTYTRDEEWEKNVPKYGKMVTQGQRPGEQKQERREK